MTANVIKRPKIVLLNDFPCEPRLLKKLGISHEILKPIKKEKIVRLLRRMQYTVNLSEQ